MFDASDGATAPDLLTAEVLQTIRAYERARRIDAHQAQVAAQTLLDLPIAKYPTLPLLERAWTLRQNFTAYDAMYVALAEALGTALVTADARLARAVQAHSLARAILLSQ